MRINGVMNMFQRTLRDFLITVAYVILLCAKSERLRKDVGPKQMLTLSPETLNYKEVFLLIIMVKCKSNTCFIK